MNKKFGAFFTNYGMTINGKYAYGNINGYEVNAYLKTLDTVAPLNIHFSCKLDHDTKNKIEAYLRDAKIKFFSFSFTTFGLAIGLNDITMAALIKRLPAIIDQITNCLKTNNVPGSEYCPVCGELLDPLTSQKCNVDNYFITLDNQCVANINAVIVEENQSFEQAPNNYFKGFLGALIGGLCGLIIAILLYSIGFISSFSAFIATIVGFFLYQKFGGKPNKLMIVIVTITTVVCMALSIFAIYIYAASTAAKSVGVDLNAFEAFGICMGEGEFAGLFIADLSLTLLFTAIGIIYQIIIKARALKRKKSI